MAIKPIPYKGAKSRQTPGSGEDLWLQKWLRTLEPSQIRQFLKERQIEAGAVAIAIFFLFFAVQIGMQGALKIKEIDQQIALMTQKKVPLDAKKKIVEEKAGFLKELVPGIQEKQFISFVTGVADKRKITISEFQPVTTQAREFHVSTNLAFSCSVPSFSRALLLLRDLEMSRYSVKIMSLHLKGPGQTIGIGDIKMQNRPVDINVKLSSLALTEKK